MRKYSVEEKLRIIKLVLEDKRSITSTAAKEGIDSTNLAEWIRNYEVSGLEAFQHRGWTKRTSAEKKRKTTFEERGEIASYCISHNHNYAETSQKFKVSYQQARNYTIKYEAGGVTALQDNRGKRKPEDTLTEVEKLRAEPGSS